MAADGDGKLYCGSETSRELLMIRVGHLSATTQPRDADMPLCYLVCAAHQYPHEYEDAKGFVSLATRAEASSPLPGT